MKKFAIKILVQAIDLFDDMIIARLSPEWVKNLAALTIKRIKMFGIALSDSDPNNKAQIEKIARETLLSREFQDLEKALTARLVEKISNPKIGKVILDTDALRLQMLAAFGDDNMNNGEQLKAVLEGFVKSEDFDSMAITFAELLADKYAKNETMKLFIINLVTSLVNSDDNE